MNTLHASIIPTLAFPILACATSIVACIRVCHRHFASSFRAYSLARWHSWRRKKSGVPFKIHVLTEARPSALKKHEQKTRHVKQSRDASYISGSFWNFGRFLSKPNTQDCVRCPPSLIMSYGGHAAVLVRIPQRLLSTVLMCHGE